jgi:hypothetical protein
MFAPRRNTEYKARTVRLQKKTVRVKNRLHNMGKPQGVIQLCGSNIQKSFRAVYPCCIHWFAECPRRNKPHRLCGSGMNDRLGIVPPLDRPPLTAVRFN